MFFPLHNVCVLFQPTGAPQTAEEVLCRSREVAPCENHNNAAAEVNESAQ